MGFFPYLNLFTKGLCWVIKIAESFIENAKIVKMLYFWFALYKGVYNSKNVSASD